MSKLPENAEPATPRAAILRSRAEEKTMPQEPRDLASLSPEETRYMLHELRVHQIQLEMQNEELRRAQVELEAGRARYFDLYDLAPVGYCTVSEPGLIMEANLTAATLLGMARGKLVKQPLTRFILNEDQDTYYQHRKQLFATGEPQVCELRMVKQASTPFWAHLEAAAARDDGGVPVCRIVMSDINERKQAEAERAKLEAQLQQAQKMESVGRLAGGVAHDFNNMLSVILGYAELALEKVNPSEPLHADLKEILTAAGRSAKIARQLLTFARKQTVVPKVLDLNATVTGMLKMLEQLIGEEIHLDWRPAADLWPVKVDPSQIEQILANLCINARDAIAGVGQITIETGNSAFDMDYCAAHVGMLPGDYAWLAMSDNGHGMDKETLTHIFEPFFTTKGVGAGTGLGLAMVFGAVKQNNGFIDASSAPGQGTTFTIYLPRYAGEIGQARTQGLPGAVMGGQETILLVEDELAVLALTKRMLARLGYTVLAASTPGEALRLAGEHAAQIHLFMTDVIMPGMNGRDLWQRFSAVRPNTKCLFMSGHTASVIGQHNMLDASTHFLQKPFSMEELAVKLRKVLSHPARPAQEPTPPSQR